MHIKAKGVAGVYLVALFFLSKGDSHMTQFIQMDMQILHNSALNSDEKIALALIMDRMKSSVQRSEFFDKQHQAHYVIYSVAELAQNLGVGSNTAVKILKKLAQLGLIIKQRVFSHATRIFLPTEKSESTQMLHSTTTKSQKVTSNQSTLNQNKYTDDTNDTQATVAEHIKSDALTVLGQGLIRKGGMPSRLVDILKVYAFGSREKLYTYASLIFKAKHWASKRASAYIDNAYSPFRFELNTLMTTALVHNIKTIIINAHKKAHNPNGYMMSSFMRLFEEQANAYLVNNA